MTTPNTPMTKQERDDAFVSLLDQVAAAELKKVSHLEYDSHEICAHFWGKVRAEIIAQQSDMAIHRWKQSGGPARDHQARAEKLEAPWAAADRIAGWRL